MQHVFDKSDFPELLVGLSGPDDAAVWRLDDSRALVLTTDFFTPIVDDAYTYGAIAAANSLSDIYAMGGVPALALNVAAFPEDLPAEIMTEILTGGAEKAREAGVVIAGGHTVKDREPKYGLVAVGFVDPARMLTKSGLRAGDRLILTKPLGFGLTTTALKRDAVEQADLDEAVLWMTKLNRGASELARALELQAGTDVTGFGLIGHAWEMASASAVRLHLDYKAMPFLKGAPKYAAQAMFAGGLLDNENYFAPHVEFSPDISESDRMILFDPQTSGGLLLGVPENRLDKFIELAAQSKQEVWVIGSVQTGAGIRVE